MAKRKKKAGLLANAMAAPVPAIPEELDSGIVKTAARQRAVVQAVELLIRCASQFGARRGPQDPTDDFWRKKIGEHLLPALSDLTATALEVGISRVEHLFEQVDEARTLLEESKRKLRNDVLDFAAERVGTIERRTRSKMGASGAAGRKGKHYSPLERFVAAHPYTRTTWAMHSARADLRNVSGVRIEQVGLMENVWLPGVDKSYRQDSVLDAMREDFQRRLRDAAKGSGTQR